MYLVILCSLILFFLPLGQSQNRTSSVLTFRVQGIIDSMTNGAVPHVEVHFVGDNTSQTVTVDDKGYYQADLPVGTYTMTAAFPLAGLTQYVRFFQVSAPRTITLNGSLYGTYSCDGVWVGDDEKERIESYKDSCGGKDSFPLPSDGVPLRVDIQYVRRVRTEKLISYRSDKIIQRPILVTYNLFALQADSVDYDSAARTIKAYGTVVIEDHSGKTQVESAAFKLNDGKAMRIW
jgi:hypothetical protein